jgi:type I restriction enzyme S subunit
VLRQRKEVIEIDDLTTYRRCRVQLHAKGIVLRDVVPGVAIKTKRQQVARRGEFLVAEIDAKVGGFGVVPADAAGAIVSSHYFLFVVDDTALERRFLDFYVRTKQFRDQVAARGSTNYAAIRPADLLGYTIPLPPLAEQHRIVARIDELAARIEEARGLRRQAIEEAEALQSAESGRIFASTAACYDFRPFGSLNPHVTSGPRNWGEKYAKGGLRFYRAQDIGRHGEIVQTSKVFVRPPATNQGMSARLKTGDLLIVITGATVGRCALFDESHEPGLVSQHVAICRLPSETLEPPFALRGLLSPFGQDQLIGQRYGQGKPGLNLTNIRSIGLPLPPIAEQRRIVERLESLQGRVDSLKRLQEETAAELDAMLPAVLDRAFKGEL